MGSKKRFFKNVAVFGGYSYLAMFFDTLLATVVLKRLLVPEVYGFVGIIMIFGGFIMMFSDSGLSYAIIRTNYGSRYHKVVFNLSIWVGVTLSLALCLLAYPISVFYQDKAPGLFLPTLVVSLQFITNSFNIVPKSIFRKKLEFNYLGLVDFISVIITIGFMIGMALAGYSYWSLIVPQIFKPLIVHILLQIRLKFGFPLYGWKLTKFGLKSTRSLIENISIFNIINYFARNADNFAISYRFGTTTFGLYDSAYKFLYMARRLINSILGPVLFPSLVDIKSRGEDIRQPFLDILGIINIINLCIAIPLVLFAEQIALVLWGSNWIGAAEYMPYIGAIIPMQTLVIAAMDLYMLDNKEKALLTLGIPLSLILVAGIVIGAFFSALHVVRFYALAFAFVQTPVSLYFGHYKILKFKPKQIIGFWAPKVLLTTSLIFSIWYGNKIISAILLSLMIIETIYYHGKDLLKILLLIKNKLRKQKK